MTRRSATTGVATPQATRLESDNGQIGPPKREFLLLWVAVNALAPVVPTLLGLATGALSIDLGLIDFVLALALLVFPQWFVLKRYLLHLSAWEWLWRNGLGWLLGVAAGAIAFSLLAIVVSFQFGAFQAAMENQVVVLVTIFVAAVALGLAVGLAQWPMLRRYVVPGQPWYPWAAASALSYALGGSIPQLAVLLGYSGPIKDIVTLFIGGTLGGLISGYVLLKLLHQPSSPRKSTPTNTPTYTPAPNSQSRTPRN